MIDEEVGQRGEAERGGEAIERVGDCSAQTGDEAGEPTIAQRAANAEEADWAHRNGDGETNQSACDEGVQFNGEKALIGVRTEKSPTTRDAVGLGTAGGDRTSFVYKVSM